MVGVTITKHEQGSGGEYIAHVADNDAVGKLTWADHNGVHYANSTRVPPVIGNRGVAARLVEAMVADARENGFTIRPVCSYVVAAFKRHPEWADVEA